MSKFTNATMLPDLENEDMENINESLDNTTAVKAVNSDMFLLIGTYTSGDANNGICLYRFDTEVGISNFISKTKVKNPSYLTLNTAENCVYCVEESGSTEGKVHAFSFDRRKGMLTLINSQSTASQSPCYITIDSKGMNVHTANYRGGSISSFQVNNDGSLTSAISVLPFKGNGPDSLRQERAHLHSVMYSPDEQFIFAADLGSDKLYRFTVLDPPLKGQLPIKQNSLKEFLVPAGTGPRHFDFHPNGGRYLYLLGELSGEVIVYDYNHGDLVQKQVIASDTVGARGSADIHVSPNGRFLYTSNRLKADGIAIFSIDSEDGTLTKVGYQFTAKHPRNFIITPNGKFLLVASRDENKIEVFMINQKTGLLTHTHQDILVSKPVCLKFSTIG